MSVTAYCKKCKADVAPGDFCPQCGGKLTKASRRVAWCIRHKPVADWMCWNSPMRIILPVLFVVLVMILLAEWMAGGAAALTALLQGGILTVMGCLLLAVLLLTGLVLYLQGDDLIDCVVDSKGVHISRYLPDPTPLKLMLRLMPVSAMDMVDSDSPTPLVPLGTKELNWNAMERVQLWPEKTIILLYAPRWWMRLYICCTPFTYFDVLDYMRDKVGRKKNLLLPPELIAPPKPKVAAPKSAPPPVQLSMELPPQPPMTEDDDLQPLAATEEDCRVAEDLFPPDVPDAFPDDNAPTES